MKTWHIIFVLPVLGFNQAALGEPAPKDVIVVGGEIAVNNGPTNPASVMIENGPLDVNVQNTPGVTIENGPLQPIPVTVENYAREPVTLSHITRLEVNDGSFSAGTIFTVPSDKIFVLQHVAVTKDPSGTDIDYFFILNRANFAPYVSAKGSSMINQPVTFYFEPNEQIRGGGFLTGANQRIVNVITRLSGYLVPVGSPSLAP